MGKRTYFVVQIDHLQAVLPLLSMEERGQLLTALTDHVTGDNALPGDLADKVSMAYNIMAGAIDANYAKYDETVEKRRAAARAKYAKKDNANANTSVQVVQVDANAGNTKTKTKTNTKTKTKTKTKTSVLEKDTSISSGDAINAREASAPEEDVQAASKGPGADAVRAVREAWNSLGLSQVTTVTADTNRGKQLAARLKQYGLDKVLAAIEQIRQSSFLQGQSTTGWIVTFDWFVKPNNFLKVLEGNYSDHADAPRKVRSFIPEDWASGLEEQP